MANVATTAPYMRTLDAKPNDVSIVKPGELVDVVEMTPLTLTDRRIYNLLLANAWDLISEPKEHIIPKRELQSTLHKGTDRLEDSIRRLMTAIVEVRVLRGGKWSTKRVQLLGGNSTPDADDGSVRYDFHPLMREIISESTVFARLHKQIMFALSSKYSLALYEMIQKRGNLTRNYEEFTLDEIRGFLGVPPGKLSSWINLKNKAITPALREVSELSDYAVEIAPVKGKAKQFTGVRLSWRRKDVPELKKVERELSFSKIGRKARLSGTVESVEAGAGEVARLVLRSDTFEKARKVIPGYDIYHVESEWRTWARNKPAPDSSDAAFIAFCKTYAKNNPI
jgi:hypothetical protein